MLPSLFTLVNLLCGFSSILASIDGEYRRAATLIAVAILFDIADGAVARAVGAITPFGLQFDSLADLTSFGMAPALLLYTRSLNEMYWVGWAAAGLWIACAAFRLARFNVTIDPHADKKYFIGLASPGAAAVVIATVFAFDPPADGGSRWVPVVVAVVPAVLMASSFRFRSFRDVVSPGPDRRWVTVVVGGLFATGLALAPAATGLVVAYGYVLSSPLGWLTAPVRARVLGPGSVAPPRHRLPSVFFPEADEVEDTDPDPAEG
jgi:CDP-diacylglycerol--serine O-phosphatidyltransferase